RVYALPSDSGLRGAHGSNGSTARSSNERSSFSGLFTRVEMGHIVLDLDEDSRELRAKVQPFFAETEFACLPRWPCITSSRLSGLTEHSPLAKNKREIYRACTTIFAIPVLDKARACDCLGQFAR